MKWIFQREGKDPEILDNFLIYVIVGALVGSRLMHCFAYEPDYYLANPLEILYVWKGGLASHGGMLGVITAVYIFTKKYNLSFAWMISRTAIAGTISAVFVRIGNLFNSEILGLESDLPWAIVFSRIDDAARHPVQLYEALAYSILFITLLMVYRRTQFAFSTKLLPGIFLAYMFTARFLLEYTKTRQAHYEWDLPLTTGQALSLPFVILGVLWVIWAFASTPKEKRCLKTH